MTSRLTPRRVGKPLERPRASAARSLINGPALRASSATTGSYQRTFSDDPVGERVDGLARQVGERRRDLGRLLQYLRVWKHPRLLSAEEVERGFPQLDGLRLDVLDLHERGAGVLGHLAW